MYRSLPLVLLCILTTEVAYAKDGECYWPNGEKAPSNWIQCPGKTNCCASQEACLSNNLCYQAHMNIAYRGACADESWPMSLCPRVCYEQVPDMWANIFGCPDDDNEVFTCGKPGGWVTQVCNASLGKYTWNVDARDSVVFASLPEPSDFASYSATYLAATTPTPSSTTTNSISTTSRTTGTTTGDSTGDPVGALGSPTPTPPATASPSSSHVNVALAAGLGAGLGVPLLLVSAGLLLVWTRSRNPRVESPAKGMDGNTDNPQSIYRTHKTVEMYQEAPIRELNAAPFDRRELE